MGGMWNWPFPHVLLLSIILLQSLCFLHVSVCVSQSLFQQRWMLCNSERQRSTRDIKASCFVVGLSQESISSSVARFLCLLVSSQTRGILLTRFLWLFWFYWIFSNSLFTLNPLTIINVFICLSFIFFEWKTLHEYLNINQAMCLLRVLVRVELCEWHRSESVSCQ